MNIALWLCLIAAPWARAGEAVKSLAEDQKSVAVTVYNNDLALVKDVRELKLPAGTGELRFMDVAARVIPATVRAKSLSAPGDFSVLEQNYEYDLINESRLLDKYVGKKVKLLKFNDYQDRKETVEAVLLSNNEGQVYKVGDEIYLGYPGLKVLPRLPDNLIAQPTLTWLYENRGRDSQRIEASYLTNGVSWSADYVLTLDRDAANADLSGWVTVDNKSGAAYQDAALKLVAGEVNRAAPEMDAMAKGMAFGALRAPMAPQFAEKALFEYHVYDLQRRTTIKDLQAKQISLLEAPGIKVAKELVVRGERQFFLGRIPDRERKAPVEAFVRLRNSRDNRLGSPLPAGTVRVYQRDYEGGLQFVGEDRIGHTPKDEELKLKVGESFDVTAERKQTDYRELTSRLRESAWEITLRNHKPAEAVVIVEEPVSGSWKVLESSHPYKKLDAFTIRFEVKVPKDGETKVAYRLRVGEE
ncbi:MAG: DUF4139 domain-containing protein [Elusimicrobia bacterium]|nr:DUF4139 domain-containing protein [Elusimicrobiota bacterium]